MKSNIEWKYWGDVDPLFGVSSVEGKSKTQNPWTDEEFYARGEPDWINFVRHWEHYGVERESCVEIGCGAGRMTKCLQSYFRKVHAIDVAPGMIAYAQQHCDPNVVSFHLGSGTQVPLQHDSVRAAFSSIVFQHFSLQEDGIAYFKELHRVLSKNGTVMINLPLYSFPGGRLRTLFKTAYRASERVRNAQADVKRALIKAGPGIMNTRMGRRLGEHMNGVSYDLLWLRTSLISMGFTDVEVRSFLVESEKRYHDFVFGRKK